MFIHHVQERCLAETSELFITVRELNYLSGSQIIVRLIAMLDHIDIKMVNKGRV